MTEAFENLNEELKYIEILRNFQGGRKIGSILETVSPLQSLSHHETCYDETKILYMKIYLNLYLVTRSMRFNLLRYAVDNYSYFNGGLVDLVQMLAATVMVLLDISMSGFQ